MSDTKDNGGGFLRKVVRFVAHPTTEWGELTTQEARETDYAKSELKASIERKKRNDFVRRREFDMLRKVRREGLNEAVLGTMGPISLDSEVRLSELAARSDIGVKAKIDAIEQQMVGEGAAPRPRSRPAPAAAKPPLPAEAPNAGERRAPATTAGPLWAQTTEARPAAPAVSSPRPAPVEPAAPVLTRSPAGGAATVRAALLDEAPERGKPQEAAAVEVYEVVHDAELDEIVIAFANADFSSSETLLRELVQPGGARAQQADTWLVLCDLYRATGQQAKFESLALEYASRFGLSPPQWFSLPRLAAESTQAPPPEGVPVAAAPAAASASEASWSCPEVLDEQGVEALRAALPKLPVPWVMDWAALRQVTPAAVGPLHGIWRDWASQPCEMHWLGAECLQQVLRRATPAGLRDVDPQYWLLHLEMLRLLNRPDRFDELAIDYCITYEVSPPAWEPARCKVHLDEGEFGAADQLITQIRGISAMFIESQVTDDTGPIEVAALDLSGQLVGDISGVLQALEGRLGSAAVLKVCCERLIRVDFIAAGDLLNWVLTRRSEGRTVVFEDAHRLLALFFGAMGITEHAHVKVRNI